MYPVTVNRLPSLPDAFDTIWNQNKTPIGTLGYAGAWIQTRGTGFAHLRVLDVYGLVLLIDGSGRYRDSDGRNLRVIAGDVIVLVPDLGHHYGSLPGERWSEVFLTFRGDAFDGWRKKGALEPGRKRLDSRRLSYWTGRWLDIAKSNPKNDYEHIELLSSIHLLISDLWASEDSDSRSDKSSGLEGSRHHLDTWPPNQTPDWKAVAHRAGYSYSGWRQAFRRAHGVSPGTYRRTVLMKQAAKLLTRSKLSNGELAERFGCCDAYHFSKLFKAIHGVSPRQYRQQVRDGTE